MRRVRSRSLFALAALAVVMTFAGCARPAETHTVTIEGTRFTPESLTIAVGDSVVWINKDPFPHTATSKAGGFDSGSLAPDQSWKFTAGAKGEFPYVCTFHPTMNGKLQVQ